MIAPNRNPATLNPIRLALMETQNLCDIVLPSLTRSVKPMVFITTSITIRIKYFRFAALIDSSLECMD